jgi:hypothetical protein
LAAFLAAIDSLVQQGLDGRLADETQVGYVSPLKALSNDIQRNLEAPLAGIRAALHAQGLTDAARGVAVMCGRFVSAMPPVALEFRTIDCERVFASSVFVQAIALVEALSRCFGILLSISQPNRWRLAWAAPPSASSGQLM